MKKLFKNEKTEFDPDSEKVPDVVSSNIYSNNTQHTNNVSIIACPFVLSY